MRMAIVAGTVLFTACSESPGPPPQESAQSLVRSIDYDDLTQLQEARADQECVAASLIADGFTLRHSGTSTSVDGAGLSKTRTEAVYVGYVAEVGDVEVTLVAWDALHPDSAEVRAGVHLASPANPLSRVRWTRFWQRIQGPCA